MEIIWAIYYFDVMKQYAIILMIFSLVPFYVGVKWFRFLRNDDNDSREALVQVQLINVIYTFVASFGIMIRLSMELGYHKR